MPVGAAERLGSVPMAERIDYEGLQRLRDDGATIVEVLPAEDYEELHVAGAQNIPLKELDAQTTAGIDKANPVVVYCWDYL
jgi:rhodanese-related sulfurtransferase